MHLYRYTYLIYDVNICKYIHVKIFAQKKNVFYVTKTSTNNVNMTSQKHLGTFSPTFFLCVSINTETHRPYRETKTIKNYPPLQISSNPP